MRRLERNDFLSNRHPAPSCCLSMILSENRYPLFRIMLQSAPHEFLDNFRRHRRRFQLAGIVGMTADQDARFPRLDRQRLALEHPVRDLEAGALEALDPA